MNSVGIRRSGRLPWKITRLKMIASSTGQKVRPMLKKNQEISAGACCTPAMGTSMLPTTGRNQAGLRWMTSKWVWCIHCVMTCRVSTRCSAVPVNHSSLE